VAWPWGRAQPCRRSVVSRLGEARDGPAGGRQRSECESREGFHGACERAVVCASMRCSLALQELAQSSVIQGARVALRLRALLPDRRWDSRGREWRASLSVTPHGPAEIKFRRGELRREGSGKSREASGHLTHIATLVRARAGERLRSIATRRSFKQRQMSGPGPRRPTSHRHESFIVVAMPRGQAANGRTWPRSF